MLAFQTWMSQRLASPIFRYQCAIQLDQVGGQKNYRTSFNIDELVLDFPEWGGGGGLFFVFVLIVSCFSGFCRLFWLLLAFGFCWLFRLLLALSFGWLLASGVFSWLFGFCWPLASIVFVGFCWVLASVGFFALLAFQHIEE